MKQQIEPAYATSEQGKKLKEKGFNVPCVNYYTPKFTEHGFKLTPIRNSELGDFYSAPEQWQIVEWLRINHGIHVEIICDCYGELWYAYLKVCSREVWEDEDKCHNILTAYQKFNNEHKSKKEAYSAVFDYILNKLI